MPFGKIIQYHGAAQAITSGPREIPVLTAARDSSLWDTEVAGFGLKVTSKSGKVYVLQYRIAGRLRCYTIGRHGSPWTPETARTEALRLLRQVKSGIDPA